MPRPGDASHSQFQRKMSPFTMLKACSARPEVAAHSRCRASSRASVMSVSPSYCWGDPGKTNGRPVSRQIVA